MECSILMLVVTVSIQWIALYIVIENGSLYRNSIHSRFRMASEDKSCDVLFCQLAYDWKCAILSIGNGVENIKERNPNSFPKCKRFGEYTERWYIPNYKKWDISGHFLMDKNIKFPVRFWWRINTEITCHIICRSLLRGICVESGIGIVLSVIAQITWSAVGWYCKLPVLCHLLIGAAYSFVEIGSSGKPPFLPIAVVHHLGTG